MNGVLSFLKIHFYYLEQYINKLILNDLSKTTIVVFILIFMSGILSSLNPCSISILPIAISYINTTKTNYQKQMLIAGIASSFIMTVIFTSLINKYCQTVMLNTPIIYSIFMIGLGLSLLEVIHINFTSLNLDKIYSYVIIDLIKDYITGFIIGLNSSSCSTPILATIIFWISQSQSTNIGITYIICYLLGYIIPLVIIIQIAMNYAKLVRVKDVWNYLIPISGSVMLGLGTLSLFNNIFI